MEAETKAEPAGGSRETHQAHSTGSRTPGSLWAFEEWVSGRPEAARVEVVGNHLGGQSLGALGWRE